MRLTPILISLFALASPALAACPPAPPFVKDCTVQADDLNRLAPLASPRLTGSPTVNGALIVTGKGENYVSGYAGYDPTGATDSSAALQACLNAAGQGGSCVKDANSLLLIANNVAIPASTTLNCSDGFALVGHPPPSPTPTSAIILDPAFTISAAGGAAGQSTAIKGCLIYRRGMVFPAPNASAFAGIAISDGGQPGGDFVVEDTVILGFATCLNITGVRPYINHFYADCADSTLSKGAVELDPGDTDSGYFLNSRIYSFSSYSAGCTANIRPGDGLRIAGGSSGAAGISMDNIVIQNYTHKDYDIENSVVVGKIWQDSLGVRCSTDLGEIGIYIGPNASFVADQVYTNAAHIDLFVDGITDIPHINYLVTCCAFLDAIQIGDPSNPGLLDVGTMNPQGAGRYGVYLNNPASRLIAHDVYIDGGPLPVFATSTVAYLGRGNLASFSVDNLYSSLGSGTNSAFQAWNGTSGFLATTGSGEMMRGITPSVAGCTGLGSGACTLSTASDAVTGLISLAPAGSPSTSGTVPLTLPFTAWHYWVCSAGLSNGTSVWPTTTQLASTVTPQSNQVTFNWALNGGALTAGQTYTIAYPRCEAF